MEKVSVRYLVPKIRERKKGDKLYYEKVLKLSINVPLQSTKTYKMYRDGDKVLIVPANATKSDILKFVYKILDYIECEEDT